MFSPAKSRQYANDFRMLAEEMIVGVRGSDPGYDDLPEYLSASTGWPSYGDAALAEAMKYAHEAGDMCSDEQVEAIGFAIQEAVSKATNGNADAVNAAIRKARRAAASDAPSNVVQFPTGTPKARAAGKKKREGSPYELRIVNGNDLRASVKIQPWFLVPDMVPGRKVKLLMGEDGAGKSMLMLLLGVCTALGLKFMGRTVRRGAVVFYTAEEELADVADRVDAIVRALGLKNPDLKDLHIIAVDDDDDSDESGFVLGGPGGDGKIKMTALWESLVHDIGVINPVLVMIDPLSEIFDGNEIVRVHTRQFIAPMRKLARKNDFAMILSGHVSEEGRKSGRGSSGSTGWSALMRARSYLQKICDDKGVEIDPNKRLWTFKKMTSGAQAVEIELAFNGDGVLLPVVAEQVEVADGQTSINATLALIARKEQWLVERIDERNRQRRVLTFSGPRATGYAPKELADEFRKEFKGAKKPVAEVKEIADMLIKADRVHLAPFGYASECKTKLVTGPMQDYEASNKPKGSVETD